MKLFLIFLASLLFPQNDVPVEADSLGQISVYQYGRIQPNRDERRPFPDSITLLDIPSVRAQLRAKDEKVQGLVAEVKERFAPGPIFAASPEKRAEYRSFVAERMKETLGPIDLEKIEGALDRRRFYAVMPSQYLEKRGETPDKALAFETYIVSSKENINERIKKLYSETLVILFAEFPEYLRNDLKSIVMDGKRFFPSPALLRLDLQRITKDEFSPRPPHRTSCRLELNALSELDLSAYTRGNLFFEFGERLAQTGIPKTHPAWRDYSDHVDLAFKISRELSEKLSKLDSPNGDPVKAANRQSLQDEADKEAQKIIDHIMAGLSQDEVKAYKRYVVGCEMLIFGPSKLLQSKEAEQTLNFKFELSHRERLKKSAPQALEFLTKEMQQLERDVLKEAAASTGNRAILDKHFRWLDHGVDVFPSIELLLREDVMF